MKRSNSAVMVAATLLSMACSSVPKQEWRKPGMEPNSQEARDQRAKDLADCATRAGAPTEASQSLMGYSRAQIADCMHSRGWREVPVED